jgi:hypothetical protein
MREPNDDGSLKTHAPSSLKALLAWDKETVLCLGFRVETDDGFLCWILMVFLPASETKDLTSKDPNQVSWPFMDSDNGWCAGHPIVPVDSILQVI